jgi:hypothetical protein
MADFGADKAQAAANYIFPEASCYRLPRMRLGRYEISVKRLEPNTRVIGQKREKPIELLLNLE